MNTDTATLDADELMHLAMRASGQAQPEIAIGYLKRVIELQPDYGKAYYLLGALHAEIGMFDRAVHEIEHAIELNVDMPTAHFQLGLLHLTSGRIAEAMEAWRALDALGEDDALLLFKRGLLHLVQDEFAECVADLKRGMALNTMNPALNQDMARILAQAEPLANPIRETDMQTDDAGGKHVLLSAYKRNDFDKEH